LMTVAIPALAETAAAGHIGVGSTTTTSAARDVRGLDVAYTTRLSRLHRFFRRSVQ
jgi:hypothetical protein